MYLLILPSLTDREITTAVANYRITAALIVQEQFYLHCMYRKYSIFVIFRGGGGFSVYILGTKNRRKKFMLFYNVASMGKVAYLIQWYQSISNACYIKKNAACEVQVLVRQV